MPARQPRLQDESTIKPTARDKGLEMTIRIVAYDSGLVEVDGTPMSQERRDDGRYEETDGWIDAHLVMAQKIVLLRRQVRRRRAQK